jgi:hypothetical protein
VAELLREEGFFVCIANDGEQPGSHLGKDLRPNVIYAREGREVLCGAYTNCSIWSPVPRFLARVRLSQFLETVRRELASQPTNSSSYSCSRIIPLRAFRRMTPSVRSWLRNGCFPPIRSYDASRSPGGRRRDLVLAAIVEEAWLAHGRRRDPYKAILRMRQFMRRSTGTTFARHPARSMSLSIDYVKAPSIGHTLESVKPTILELDSRLSHQVFDRA